MVDQCVCRGTWDSACVHSTHPDRSCMTWFVLTLNSCVLLGQMMSLRGTEFPNTSMLGETGLCVVKPPVSRLLCTVRKIEASTALKVKFQHTFAVKHIKSSHSSYMIFLYSPCGFLCPSGWRRLIWASTMLPRTSASPTLSEDKFSLYASSWTVYRWAPLHIRIALRSWF